MHNMLCIYEFICILYIIYISTNILVPNCTFIGSNYVHCETYTYVFEIPTDKYYKIKLNEA